MRVRLTRKLAEVIDGIDLRDHAVGDILELSEPEARLLLAEEWAVAEGCAAECPRQFVYPDARAS